MSLEKVSEHGAFGGRASFWKHASTSTACDMGFGLFLPSPYITSYMLALSKIQ